MYVRRHEPQVVFGSIDAGVPNTARDDRHTFLDVVWQGAPFANHAQFVSAVTRVASEWAQAGRFTAAQVTAVVDAARRAEETLRVSASGLRH
jgi:hypothetical protein